MWDWLAYLWLYIFPLTGFILGKTFACVWIFFFLPFTHPPTYISTLYLSTLFFSQRQQPTAADIYSKLHYTCTHFHLHPHPFIMSVERLISRFLSWISCGSSHSSSKRTSHSSTQLPVQTQPWSLGEPIAPYRRAPHLTGIILPRDERRAASMKKWPS